MFIRRKKNFFQLLRMHINNFSLVSFILLCLVFFLLFQGFWVLEKRLRPVILSVAEVKADILATEAVHEAILLEVVAREYFMRI